MEVFDVLLEGTEVKQYLLILKAHLIHANKFQLKKHRAK